MRTLVFTKKKLLSNLCKTAEVDGVVFTLSNV